jgi:hypothetical protein
LHAEKPRCSIADSRSHGIPHLLARFSSADRKATFRMA